MNLSVKMASSPTRLHVLSLYRRILRLGQTWESKDPACSAQDREYIREEAQTLFRKNKDLADPQQIWSSIHEAEARVDIALHYKVPYPRPVNVPPQAMAKRKGKEQGSAQEKLKKKARPIYIKSLD